MEGTGTGDLRRGPGHYPDTPLPGARGTVAVAGHRTTYGAPFRRLDELDRGDRVEMVMPYGRFRYRVERTRIVPATATWVTRKVGPRPARAHGVPSALLGGAAHRGLRAARGVAGARRRRPDRRRAPGRRIDGARRACMASGLDPIDSATRRGRCFPHGHHARPELRIRSAAGLAGRGHAALQRDGDAAAAARRRARRRLRRRRRRGRGRDARPARRRRRRDGEARSVRTRGCAQRGAGPCPRGRRPQCSKPRHAPAPRGAPRHSMPGAPASTSPTQVSPAAASAAARSAGSTHTHSS